MSNYTTKVRYICESIAGYDHSQDFASVDDIIKKSAPVIFDFAWPIHKESHREELERLILLSYYTREIGMETYGAWRLKLMAKLNRIMPYYNQLYATQDLKFDPFLDVDLTTTSDGTSDHNSTGSSQFTRTDNLSETSNSTTDTAGTTTNNRTSHDETDEIKSDRLMRTGTDKVEGSITANGNSATDHSTSSNNTRTPNITVRDSGHTDVLKSDTPQGRLTEVENNNYLSEATRNILNTSQLTSGTEKTTGSDTGTDTTDSMSSTKTTDTTTHNTTDAHSISGTLNTDGTVRDNGETESNSTTTGTRKNTGTQQNNGTTSSNSDTVDHNVTTVKGKNGGKSYMQLLKEYRQNILNIDLMIVEELDDLFMRIY